MELFKETQLFVETAGRKWRVCGVSDVSVPVQPQEGRVSVCMHSDNGCTSLSFIKKKPQPFYFDLEFAVHTIKKKKKLYVLLKEGH